MIKLTNVSKIYKTGVRALNDMNLTIEPGEFVYVIGTTGAGKSTFIKLLYREEKATSGKVEVVVGAYQKLKIEKSLYFRRNIGLYFKILDFYQKIKTVFENAAFALEVIDTPCRVENCRRVRATLELVGLEDKVTAFPHELQVVNSSVLNCCAIVNKPKALIADEPTGNLDPETSEEIINLLERINEQQNTTILVVTHDSKIVLRT